jgi:hypothetical protein
MVVIPKDRRASPTPPRGCNVRSKDWWCLITTRPWWLEEGILTILAAPLMGFTLARPGMT